MITRYQRKREKGMIELLILLWSLMLPWLVVLTILCLRKLMYKWLAILVISFACTGIGVSLYTILALRLF